MTEITPAAPRMPMSPHDRAIEVGEVARATFAIFRRTPWKFSALTLLPFPVALASELPKFVMGDYHGAAALLSGLLALSQYFIQYIGQLATVHGAERLMAGSNYTIGEALGVGVRRFPSLIGLGILTGLVILAGFLLLIVPGLIWGVMFSLGTAACVIERLGPVEAMKRSAFLTKGNRWRVVGSSLLVLFLPALGALAIFAVPAILIAASHSDVLTVLAAIAAVLVFIPALVVFSAVAMILLAVLFVELRRVKEGVLPGQTLTQVFE